MDEPAVTHLAKALSDVTDIVHKIAGPVAEEFGLILGDKAREYRLRNLIHTLPRVQKMLADARIDPSPIPPRLSLPALEAASLEDSTILQERWAALLANATNPKHWAPVLPAYVEILKQLSPQEASVLDGIYGHVTLGETLFREIGEAGFLLGGLDLFDIFLRNPPPEMIEEDGSVNRRFIAEMIQNLVRLGIIIRYEGDPGSWQPAEPGAHIWTVTEAEYYLTAFGYAFLRACHAPRSPTQSG